MNLNGFLNEMAEERIELKRLARIGRATEKAFAEHSCVLFIDSRPDVNECYEFELTDTNQLLEWAENK